MSFPYKYVGKLTGPMLQVSGTHVSNRYSRLNFTGSIGVLDEPTITRYTLSVDSLSENATVVDLYNKVDNRRSVVQKSVPLNGFNKLSGSTSTPNWIADPDMGSVRQLGLDVTASYFIGLDLPNGVRLDSLTASITPSAGHVGLPSIMPGVTLFYVSGTTKTVISAQSSSVTLSANYNNTTHTISVSLSGSTVNNSYRYVLEFNGEGGTNGVSNLIFNHVWFNWTAPSGSYNS